MLEPRADGFRNYLRDGHSRRAEDLLASLDGLAQSLGVVAVGDERLKSQDAARFIEPVEALCGDEDEEWKAAWRAASVESRPASASTPISNPAARRPATMSSRTGTVLSPR